MKRVNLCVPLKEINGDKFQDENGNAVLVKDRLANVLYMAPAKNDPAREFTLVTKIVDCKGAMDMEDADYNSVLQTVKTAKNIPLLISAQFLKALEPIVVKPTKSKGPARRKK